MSAAFRDTRLSADRIEPLQRLADERPEEFGAVVELLSGWMIFRDPPAHTHLRDPVRRAVPCTRPDSVPSARSGR